jgi:hypothetical protein
MSNRQGRGRRKKAIDNKQWASKKGKKKAIGNRQ